jgi:hypothetical protein
MPYPIGRRFCLSQLVVLILGWPALVPAAPPIRIWFDDHYQRPRDEREYGQGVARGGKELRSLSNFYRPDANAIPNGTFAFAQLVRDRFRVETTQSPLSEELLASAGGYVLICPVKVSHGGRAALGEREARLLHRFVEGGGLLLIVANSFTDEEASPTDLEGLNHVARSFGVEFLARQTETLSIPIPNDHPYLDGPSDLIYGNGTTVRILDDAKQVEVLLNSSNPAVPGPVAVVVPAGRGRALFFGDAGTFGNAHVVRTDVGQSQGVRQLMEALLPAGPCPDYGWKDGLRFRIKLRQEQILSGYPEFMPVFSLPHPAGTTVYSSGMRQVDVEAGVARGAAAASHDFVSIVAPRETELQWELTADTRGGYHAAWRARDTALEARLLKDGRLVDPAVPVGAEALDWQHALLNELLCAPLRRHAQTGETWSARGVVALPQFQLGRPAQRVVADSTFRFEGEDRRGDEDCFVFTRSTQLEGKDWSPQQLVDPALAPQFDDREIQMLGGGLVAEGTYWISQRTRLPVRSELRVSATCWWNDARFPSSYLGSHDAKTYENWSTVVFVATYGRTFSADFEALDGPP